MSQTTSRPGVFGFLVSDANRIYLGAAVDVDFAIDQLVSELNSNQALNYDLQQDWKAYDGEAGVDITILEEIEDDSPQALANLLSTWMTRISYAEEI